MSKSQFASYWCLVIAVAVSCPSVLGGQEVPAAKPQAKAAPSQSKKQKNYPPQMAGAKVETYKKIGDTELKLYIFEPKTHQGNESRPAIVFFFGGGWRGGTPQQFEQHCRYLASRGMIAITADYRVASRNQTKADACVRDGKSAIRWVRKNARRLGVDPDRIVAGGGSAGGHVAACTATIEGFEESSEHTGEESGISSRPNGLALFNPALVLSSVKGEKTITPEKLASLKERMGAEPAELSPFHQLKKGLPPTILFHGKADKTVPFRTAELFIEKGKANGDPVVLDGYEGQGHGFFNAGRGDDENYKATMKNLDMFLVDHGLLEGPTPKSIKTIKPQSDKKPNAQR